MRKNLKIFLLFNIIVLIIISGIYLVKFIKETNKDTYGLSYTFTLSPSSNFNNINIVSVIKGGK